jgi:hypothetical protein
MRHRWPVALTSSAISLLLSFPVAAQGAFDGSWSVRIVVENGPCVRPPGFRYFVKIAGNVVTSNSGDSGTTITGRVDASGTVRVSAARGVDRASGTGRLIGQAGSGIWNSSTRHCSGSWTSVRQ